MGCLVRVRQRQQQYLVARSMQWLGDSLEQLHDVFRLVGHRAQQWMSFPPVSV